MADADFLRKSMKGWAALVSNVRDDALMREISPSAEIINNASRILMAQDKHPFRGIPWSVVGKDLGEVFGLPIQDKCIGFIDKSTGAGEINSYYYLIEGWAWDKGDGQPPTAILLVDDSNKIVGAAGQGVYRGDVVGVSNRYTGWMAYSHKPAQEINFYAIVGRESSVCRLEYSDKIYKKYFLYSYSYCSLVGMGPAEPKSL